MTLFAQQRLRAEQRGSKPGSDSTNTPSAFQSSVLPAWSLKFINKNLRQTSLLAAAEHTEEPNSRAHFRRGELSYSASVFKCHTSPHHPRSLPLSILITLTYTLTPFEQSTAALPIRRSRPSNHHITYFGSLPLRIGSSTSVGHAFEARTVRASVAPSRSCSAFARPVSID